MSKPRVERLEFPPDITNEILNLALESYDTGLEKGAALCTGHAHINRVHHLGNKCTGTSCRVKVANCGVERIQLGDFHTHPYDQEQTFDPSDPSWGDLYSMLWKWKYQGGPAIGCRMAITPKRVHPLYCNQPKELPDEQMWQALTNVWQMDKFKAGWDSFPNSERYFHKTVKVPLPPLQALKIEERMVETRDLATRCHDISDESLWAIGRVERLWEKVFDRTATEQEKETICAEWRIHHSRGVKMGDEIDEIFKKLPYPSRSYRQCEVSWNNAEAVRDMSNLRIKQYCQLNK